MNSRRGGRGYREHCCQGAANVRPEAITRACIWGWILGDEGGGFDIGRKAGCALLSRAVHGHRHVACADLRKKNTPNGVRNEGKEFMVEVEKHIPRVAGS